MRLWPSSLSLNLKTTSLPHFFSPLKLFLTSSLFVSGWSEQLSCWCLEWSWASVRLRYVCSNIVCRYNVHRHLKERQECAVSINQSCGSVTAAACDAITGLIQTETGGEETAEEEEHVELFTTPAKKMGAATSDFGYNLFRVLSSREATANIFLAPISVSAVLSQLSMGEDTNTPQTKTKLVPWPPRCVRAWRSDR